MRARRETANPRQMPAVIGASIHCGWAELVAVGADNSEPRVLDRWRVALDRPGEPRSPYHHEALEIELAEAEMLIAEVRRTVARHATTALRGAKTRWAVAGCVFERSPYDALPPTLTEILASRAVTCAADGMMYRETFADCAADLGIPVVRYPRKVDVIEMAAEALGIDGCRLGAALKRLGASVGAPWRKEHRYAAAAAIMVLGGLVGPGNLWLTA